MANDDSIDLVLMDINLGSGIDGTEAAEIILKSRDLPLIFLSSHREPEIVEKSEKASSYGYVVKSSTTTVLDASIKMAFKLFAAKEQIKEDNLAREKAKAELVNSEKRYRRLFESARDGILILDAQNGRIVDVNPFLVELLGYPREEFARKTIWEIGFLKDLVANKEAFLDLQLKGYARYEDLPLETAEGKILDVEFISNVYMVDERKVIQCNIREIGARKKTEALLASGALEKQELLRELQHRVKNSFNLISIMINMAADKSESPPDKAAMEQLEGRVRSVSELYALLYASGSVLAISLDEYCASVAKASIGPTEAITLATRMDEVTVSAKEAAPIGLILTEIITNAIKYAFADSGKGRIELSLRKNARGALLQLSDDGHGLPEGFDPARSAGLGLKLVAGLAEQIKGEFTIEGRGRGTRCALQFPL